MTRLHHLPLEGLEEIVLIAIDRVGNNASARLICDGINQVTGLGYRVTTIHTVLSRLNSKGMVAGESRVPPVRRHGMKRTVYYSVTGLGTVAVQSAEGYRMAVRDIKEIRYDGDR